MKKLLTWCFTEAKKRIPPSPNILHETNSKPKKGRTFLRTLEKRNAVEFRKNGEKIDTDDKSKKKRLNYIPVEIMKQIHKKLQKFQVRKFVAVGSPVKLACDISEEAAIRDAVTNMSIKWVFNNKAFKIDNKRIISHGESAFEILNFRPNDQGLYTCQVVIGHKFRKTVFFASMATRSQGIPKTVTERGMLKLWCPSSPIGRMFDNVYRDWTLQGNFIYHDVPAALRQEELIANVSMHHTGRWTCSVVDKTLHRTWILIRYQVKVKPLPPPANPFIDFAKSHPVLTVTQTFNAVAFLFVLFIILVHRSKIEQLDEHDKKQDTNNNKEIDSSVPEEENEDSESGFEYAV